MSSRFNITAINPARAFRHARALLNDWKQRHPTQGYARVLNAKGEEMGLRIDAQHEDVFKFMHRI